MKCNYARRFVRFVPQLHGRYIDILLKQLHLGERNFNSLPLYQEPINGLRSMPYRQFLRLRLPFALKMMTSLCDHGRCFHSLLTVVILFPLLKKIYRV